VSFTDALSPSRRRGVELLDNRSADTVLATRSLRDIARSNRWFGGASAVIAELVPVLANTRPHALPLALLDVGTGAGDIPELARRVANRGGVQLITFGLEISGPLAAASRARSGDAIAGDALALPFADRSVDIVTCSQVLHHFDGAESARILSEMHRVARVRVIVADIRRTWAAAAGFWMASWPLRFHPVTRHDGVVSVFRGYRANELAAAVYAATGCRPAVRNRRGFRVTASWAPA
jgi:SAM-dependent methyltransferase